jgi:hypothetical protein
MSIRKKYEMKPIKLGKIKNGKARGMTKNATWVLNQTFAIIIRDYLKLFNEVSPAIGSCVYTEEERVKTMITSSESRKIDDEKYKEWKGLVNHVADQFDALAKAIDGNVYDNEVPFEEQKKMARQAFKDLNKIYMDLWW